MAAEPEMTPLISVVMNFLNRESFIAEAIDSVLTQTCVDWELVLVDDGSSDGSTAIAKDYAARFARKIRYVDHTGHANLGASASRNKGAAIAKGTFLAFLDSDDVWMPRKLEEQAALLAAHRDAVLVCGAILYWHSWDGASVGDRAVLTAGIADRLMGPPEVALRAYPLGRSSGAGVDFMVLRSVFKALGGFEEAFPGMFDDQSFLLKVFTEHTVYISSKVWLKYRQHPDSCSEAVHTDGSYEWVRRRFLDWFADYLASHELDPRLAKALARARRPPSRLATLTRRVVKGVIRRIVPPGDGPLGDLHA